MLDRWMTHASWFTMGVAVLTAVLFAVVACEDAGDPVGELAPDPQDVSFGDEILPILALRCATVGCHSGTQPAGFMNLSAATAYQELLNETSQNPTYIAIANRVVPGQPSRSLMLQKILAAADRAVEVGNRMPLARTPLSGQDTARVRVWIEEGAVDDRP